MHEEQAILHSRPGPSERNNQGRLACGGQSRNWIGMKKSVVFMAALALFSGCAKKQEPVAAAPAAPAPKAELGEFGLDLTAGNPDVKPGDDFFAYASGKWYDTFEIPPDRASY